MSASTPFFLPRGRGCVSAKFSEKDIAKNWSISCSFFETCWKKYQNKGGLVKILAFFLRHTRKKWFDVAIMANLL